MHPDSVRETDRVPHGGSDDPDLLEFSANTNPHTPEGVAEVYADALGAARSYPNDDYPEFREAAADFADCDPGDVVPTPGGLAALRLAFAARVSPGDSVLVPYPSFGEYAREIRLQGGDPEFVPHDELLDADPADHAAAVVCNPNNPTGDAYDPDALREFAVRCREADALLVADEAFLGFTDRPSLAGSDGVVVARSLTKLFGLPGLRAGFAAATGDLGDDLATARRAWSLGTPAARVGAHCLGRSAFVAETRERVRRERARMADALRDDFGVYAPDGPPLSASSAPFLLLDLRGGGPGSGEQSPAELVAAARERGVAVRDATTFRGLDSHVRVAVRTPDENDRLLEVLADVRD
ncbi:aminotransferase class I/II-fold pyridoxal phosphate-dependent enzyme [Halorussus sp. MSC15.2]|uniref:aminotransferase class I/II-fold pyridoxal phosphate-dependent enzyme n=1 Tax=Halorussus sp. MSC15.2 TaxID=2283638 RepID=UPI0013D64847|nr:aminotransferase class I/II-fold pyridoxal phosphate-dependent enzyme [Halorussus sp. MSC15.2]NEU57794.1 aminotransferase class I/II-fold pyridoxal phosphate-dependent enzyme [Halorussus sp. MSC15.2]